MTKYLQAFQWWKWVARHAAEISVNQGLFKVHDLQVNLVYKVANYHATDGQDLFFLFDIPHLIKTVCKDQAYVGKAKHFHAFQSLQNHNYLVQRQ